MRLVNARQASVVWKRLKDQEQEAYQHACSLREDDPFFHVAWQQALALLDERAQFENAIRLLDGEEGLERVKEYAKRRGAATLAGSGKKGA